MLGRQNRFHGRTSVLPVYRKSAVVRADGCSLHYVLNPRRHDYRLAVVVSKKVSKSAVQRNRIRRRVYEIVRESVLINQPIDIIITVYDEGFATMNHSELQDVIGGLLQKIKLVNTSTNSK